MNIINKPPKSANISYDPNAPQNTHQSISQQKMTNIINNSNQMQMKQNITTDDKANSSQIPSKEKKK